LWEALSLALDLLPLEEELFLDFSASDFRFFFFFFDFLSFLLVDDFFFLGFLTPSAVFVN